MESCDWLGLHPFSNQTEDEHYIKVVLEAMDASTKTWFAQGTARTFRSSAAFDLVNAPFGQLADLGHGEKDRRFALLGLLHVGVNNLPTGLKMELAARV